LRIGHHRDEAARIGPGPAGMDRFAAELRFQPIDPNRETCCTFGCGADGPLDDAPEIRRDFDPFWVAATVNGVEDEGRDGGVAILGVETVDNGESSPFCATHTASSSILVRRMGAICSSSSRQREMPNDRIRFCW